MLHNLEIKGHLIIPENVTSKIIINAEQIWFNGPNAAIIPGTKEIMEMSKD